MDDFWVELEQIRREAAEKRAKSLKALPGKTIRTFVEVPGMFIRFFFTDDTELYISISGGEMDGHFDPPSNRSLKLQFKDKE